MKTCEDFLRAWRTILAGDSRPEAPEGWEEHAAMCAECGRERDGLRTILDGAEALHEDVRRAMNGVDWDGLAERIAGTAFAGRLRAEAVPARRRAFWADLFAPPRRFVFAALLAGIVLGAGTMSLVLRTSVFRGSTAAALRPSGELVERVEFSLAKREAIDYLNRSQALLLDFVQATPEAAARSLSGGDSSRRARDLLAKKRYINRGLESVRMAKAREICNQIEILFLELTQLGGELTPQEAAEIQRFVEDKNLLFRIRLIRRELEESEV
ncbi:MAG: hypothetical protein FJY82_11275 [Candidatus Aminicenantes bacterium]|nr:hypothetical protein [Candidatus Aminicenantes bacterium]